MPQITVIIPTLLSNQEYLAKCLDSLKDQSYSDFEVLVMVNDTEAKAQEYLHKYPNFGKNVAFTALGSNQGFTGAVNAGIERSRGKYIVLLNDDTEADKNWLKELLKTQQDTGAHMVASTIYLSDKKTLDSLGFSFAWRGKAEAINDIALSFETDPDYWLNEENRKLLNCKDNENYWQEPFGPDAAACLYTKEMLDEIGALNKDFFAYLEDVELALRARKKGYYCALAADAVVYHHKHATSLNKSGFKSKQDMKNWWRLVIVSYPSQAIIKFILTIFIERLRNISGYLFSN